MPGKDYASTRFSALNHAGAVVVFLHRWLSGTADNLQRWIHEPQQISPDTAMPNLRVGEQDARDISAFLYTRAE